MAVTPSLQEVFVLYRFHPTPDFQDINKLFPTLRTTILVFNCRKDKGKVFFHPNYITHFCLKTSFFICFIA